MKPTFFATPSEFRCWLERNHDKALELLVGFHKRAFGQPTMTWPEAVDEALCVGWIDGVRKRVDGTRYTIRFSPRKPRSIWSAINIERVKELERQGRMRPSGGRAFEQRSEEKSRIYSYEQTSAATLEVAHERLFRASKEAWAFFEAQPPWYRKTVTYWVVSAKKEATRVKRLAQLIDDSEHKRAIPAVVRPRKPK